MMVAWPCTTIRGTFLSKWWVSIIINPNPNAIAANNTFENCNLNNATLTIANATGGTAPYLYSLNNSTPSASDLNFTNLSAGTYALSVIDANGCTFTKTVSITNIPGPSADFVANQQNGSDTLNVDFTNQSSYGNNITYYWNFGNGNLDTTTNLNFSPNQTFYGTNTYTVTLIASNGIPGCNDTNSLLIYVDIKPYIEVPNVFSPNGDGRNDIFKPIPIGIVSTEYFRVYNRFGELVYQTNQNGAGWDGTFKGKPQPVGNYVWTVKGKGANSTNIELSGNVMLVR
jgi:gliding motility-associated-like protein